MTDEPRTEPTDEELEAYHRSQFPTEEAYEAYCKFCEEQENECGVEISTGGFDPYGTHCDLEHGHDGPHEGSDFFGDGRLRWTGGGSCVGDPLPFTILEHTEEAK